MKEKMIYPCTKSGRIMKGFCPTVVTSEKSLSETLLCWIMNSDRFHIQYWFDGEKVLKLL